MIKGLLIIFTALFLFTSHETRACSVLYFVDNETGKIYAANNEDYWYDTKTYIQIIPKSKGKLARLWYGWDNFAQGGVNEAGLFFDGAVTPIQKIPAGYDKPKGNLGDEILAYCLTVEQAMIYLEKKRVALKNAHMMFGDSTGNAVVVEWIDGERKVIPITNNKLIMTNFLLSAPSRGNHPCYRYSAIEKELTKLQESNETADLRKVGNALAKAVQPPSIIEDGKEGGTLYSTFINITDMEFVFAYKLDNSRITKLDLKAEFATSKKRKIKL